MSHIATSWAFKQKGISSTAKLVLIFLADYHNHKTELCFPSRTLLAEDCCCDERTITRSIQELRASGLIAYEERAAANGRKTSNTYQLFLSKGQSVPTDTVGQSVPIPRDNLTGLEPVINNIGTSSSSDLDDPVLLIFDTYEEKPKTEDKYFWDEAVGMLMGMGVANVTSRTFVGKCLKLANGDKDEILRILQVAVNKNVRDPIAYLSAALGGKQSKERVTKNQQIAEAFAELEAASERKKAQWAKDYGLDDIRGVREEDHVQLQPKQPDRSNDIPQKRGRGLRKVSARRIAQIVGPVVRDIDESQIPTNDF